MEYRLGEMIACNPTVKLEKWKKYNLVDIDSIQIGTRYVKGKELQTYEGKSGCRFQNGDTVMARITPCLENGKIAQVNCESGKGFGSTELLVFRGIEGKTDSDFVFYLMSTEYIRKLSSNSMSGASGRQRADLSFIKNVKWDFPSLSVQQRIASILNNYDKLIQNYQKQIEDLQNLASELYKEWFVRFRFPGHEKTSFENGIPKGWNVGRLGKLSNISSGGDCPKIISKEKNEICCIPVYSNGIQKDGLYGYTNKASISKESVTVSARGTIGFVCLRSEPFLPIVRLLSIEPKATYISAKFLYFYLTYNSVEGNGTSQQQITVPMIKKKKIILPSVTLLNEFEKNISPLFEKINLLKKMIENCSNMRDHALPRLMSGKLEVK